MRVIGMSSVPVMDSLRRTTYVHLMVGAYYLFFDFSLISLNPEIPSWSAWLPSHLQILMAWRSLVGCAVFFVVLVGWFSLQLLSWRCGHASPQARVPSLSRTMFPENYLAPDLSPRTASLNAPAEGDDEPATVISSPPRSQLHKKRPSLGNLAPLATPPRSSSVDTSIKEIQRPSSMEHRSSLNDHRQSISFNRNPSVSSGSNTGSDGVCYMFAPFRRASNFLFTWVMPRIGVLSYSSFSRSVLLCGCILGRWPTFEECWRLSHLHFSTFEPVAHDEDELRRYKSESDQAIAVPEMTFRHPWIDEKRKKKLSMSVQRLVTFILNRPSNPAVKSNKTVPASPSLGPFTALLSPALHPQRPNFQDENDLSFEDPLDSAALSYVLSNMEALFVSDVYGNALQENPLFCLALSRQFD